MPKPQRKDAASSEEEDKRVEELNKKIENLPEDQATVSEGVIRDLHKRVLAIQKDNVRDQLVAALRTVSCRGLDKELREMMENHGLRMEGLDLVLKYLTNKNELAQYLFENQRDVIEKDGLDAVRRRLGPSLEVLGGLIAKGINVTSLMEKNDSLAEKKTWLENLVKKSPSLQALARMSVSDLEETCKEASHGEMEDVNRLAKIAEFRTRQHSADQEDQEIGAKDEENKKVVQEEKLEKARALMKEAKEMAKKESEEAKKAVKDKMAEISKLLELPPDWNKQDIGTKPETLLEQFDKLIDQYDNVVEVSGAYKSDLEIVRKASGGRALCGIYHSDYLPPITAERPIILMPNDVLLSSPNNSQQIRYMKFSKSRAAANYVQTVKSSSTNIGFSVGGFFQLFVGEVSGSYGSSNEDGRVMSKKEQTSSASVVQYIWSATKTFKIEQEQMKLSTSARNMARSVVKDEDNARRFMQRYGSHFPAGLHTLGGVLFRIVDAESRTTKKTSELTEKAAQQLQGQISVGFLGGVFGIGASITGEHSTSSGKKSAEDEEIDDTWYTFSSQAMGPATTNPATFSKMLANNSTWALIDRGSHLSYIPIWELIRELGTDFEESANLLEQTWLKDEKYNKERSLRVGYKITEIIRKDLEMKRDQCIKKKPDKKEYGYWPTNGAQLTLTETNRRPMFTINLTREAVYEKAVEIIMADPRYRICEIALCAGELYTIRCWQASEVAEMTFDSGNGVHDLFYSDIIFKWKTKIPVK